MSTSEPRSRESGRVGVEEIIDRLYALPPAEFIEARNEAASELRKAGQREAAERVRGLAKPTAAAGAVNQLVRKHRAEVERFLRAVGVLRDAQFAGKGDLVVATQQERQQLARLVGIGGEAVRQTLLAAAADENAKRQLLEARLARDLELRGFGTLLVNAGRTVLKRPDPTAAQTRRAPPETAKPDDSAALARLSAATAALDAAQANERDARSRGERTQKELKDARAAVEKARSAAEEAQRVDLEARAAGEEARREIETARAAVDEAQRDLKRPHGR